MKCTKSKTKYWVYGVNNMTDKEILSRIYQHFVEVRDFYKHMYTFYYDHKTQDNINKMCIATAKIEIIEELLYSIEQLKG